MATVMSDDEKIEKARDLVKMMERALGEGNGVTLETISSLGEVLIRKESMRRQLKFMRGV